MTAPGNEHADDIARLRESLRAERAERLQRARVRESHAEFVKQASTVEFRYPTRNSEVVAQGIAAMLGVIVSVKRDGYLSLYGPSSPVDNVRHRERWAGEHDGDAGADHKDGHRVGGEKVAHPDQDGGPLGGGLLDRLTDVARSLFVKPKRGAAVVKAIRKLFTHNSSPSLGADTSSVGVGCARAGNSPTGAGPGLAGGVS